jgi:hypothetical protein
MNRTLLPAERPLSISHGVKNISFVGAAGTIEQFSDGKTLVHLWSELRETFRTPVNKLIGNGRPAVIWEFNELPTNNYFNALREIATDLKDDEKNIPEIRGILFRFNRNGKLMDELKANPRRKEQIFPEVVIPLKPTPGLSALTFRYHPPLPGKNSDLFLTDIYRGIYTIKSNETKEDNRGGNTPFRPRRL